MSQEERYGTRDLTYSAWHRIGSIQRYVGIEGAQTLGMIDCDASLWVEWHNGDKWPLALIETAKDINQPFKPATVTEKLAIQAGLPAYLLLYTPAQKQNPHDKRWPDIESFRVRRLHPEREAEFRTYTPGEWAKLLVQLRQSSAEQIDLGLRKKLDPLPKLKDWWEQASSGDRLLFVNETIQPWVKEHLSDVRPVHSQLVLNFQTDTHPNGKA